MVSLPRDGKPRKRPAPTVPSPTISLNVPVAATATRARKARTQRTPKASPAKYLLAPGKAEASLIAITHHLETAQDLLAQAANDLAHFARESEHSTQQKTAIKFALDTRTACMDVVEIAKCLGFWLWLEQVQRERRAKVFADATSGEQSNEQSEERSNESEAA